MLKVKVIKNQRRTTRTKTLWNFSTFVRSENGCKRHGYMGHLTKIANDLYRNMDKGKNHERLTNLYNGKLSTLFYACISWCWWKKRVSPSRQGSNTVFRTGRSLAFLKIICMFVCATSGGYTASAYKEISIWVNIYNEKPSFVSGEPVFWRLTLPAIRLWRKPYIFHNVCKANLNCVSSISEEN